MFKMDAAGARALARRIEEEQARVAEAASWPSPMRVTVEPAPRDRPSARVEATSSPNVRVEIVRLRRRPAAEDRDLRLYTRDVRSEEVDGRVTAVARVRCQTLVAGRWESRILRVETANP